LADDFQTSLLIGCWKLTEPAGNQLILVRAKCKHIPEELWRWQANIVTTIFVDGRQKNEKTEKCLELPDLARKLVRKNILRKFPLVLMGGRAEGLACADPGARTPIGASGIIVRLFFSE
jgi:hypothetical protein